MGSIGDKGSINPTSISENAGTFGGKGPKAGGQGKPIPEAGASAPQPTMRPCTADPRVNKRGTGGK